MKPEHTPEPWSVHHQRNGESIIQGEDGFSLVGPKRWSDRANANAERIVACVNACAGLEDPEREIPELRAQRDRLLSTMQAIASEEWPSDGPSVLREMARQELAQVEKGAQQG